MEIAVHRKNFSGGLNYKDGAEKIAPNEYPLLRNGRVRDGNIVPTRRPLLLTGINAERFQGSYGVENFLLVAADGFIYWKDFAVEDGAFNLFYSSSGEPLRMHPTAEIHFQAVAASSMNRARVLDGTYANDPINQGAIVNGSPACIVITDGLNQPTVVFPDGTWRRAATYEQWTPDNREYIPIGTFMYYDGVTLYMVSPNGDKLFRSVSGRPLDFVIVIDDTTGGNKAADANDSAFKFTYGSLSCIGPLYSRGDFFGSTRTEGFRLKLDFENLYFGEPSLKRIPLATGCINNYAFTTVNGDNIFVDGGGIKSFNAVESEQTKASTSPFSRTIQKLFDGAMQETPVAITLNDYSYFSVMTVFGHAIMVYDSHLNAFVSLDHDDDVVDIIRFSVVDTMTSQKLIVCTTTGVYCYDESEEVSEVGFYWGDILIGNLKQQGSTIRLKALFANVLTSGTVTVTDYVDGKAINTFARSINSEVTELAEASFEMPLPVSDVRTTKQKEFIYEGTQVQGSRLAYWISWNFNGELSALEADIYVSEDTIAPNQQQ